MAVKLRRPILIGGLGLSFGVWIWDSFSPSVLDVGGTLVWGAIAIGSSVWWLKQKASLADESLSSAPIDIDYEAVKGAIAAAETRLSTLLAESGDNSDSIADLRTQLTRLNADLHRTEILIHVVGGTAVGKSSLANQLTSDWLAEFSKTFPLQISIQETSCSSAIGIDQAASESADVLKSDLVLFVVNGDLTQLEFRQIHQFLDRNQRLLLVFNKQDQYLPADRLTILKQLQDQMRGNLQHDDIVAISTAPAPIKVRQLQSDGSLQEWLEQSESDVAGLTDRLGRVLHQEGQQLVLATVFREAQTLQAEIQIRLNQIRRDRALPLIEQYQWIAATAAFANPVPSLDVIATAAINTQLIIDLGTLYQQKFSVEQAKTAASTLASVMVKLGLVELSTQAISPLLKSHAATFVAGGLVQGISAAYLTRIAGLSLIAYFEEQSHHADAESASPFQFERLTASLTTIFQQNRRTAFLSTLVQQGIKQLNPGNSAQISLTDNRSTLDDSLIPTSQSLAKSS
ncbi:MAG: slr1306 family protein [Elainellaceae cyanobacterium]